MSVVTLNRAKENPWLLKTPPVTSEFTMHVDTRDGMSILVCTVGRTVPNYDFDPGHRTPGVDAAQDHAYIAGQL